MPKRKRNGTYVDPEGEADDHDRKESDGEKLDRMDRREREKKLDKKEFEKDM